MIHKNLRRGEPRVQPSEQSVVRDSALGQLEVVRALELRAVIGDDANAVVRRDQIVDQAVRRRMRRAATSPDAATADASSPRPGQEVYGTLVKWGVVWGGTRCDTKAAAQF